MHNLRINIAELLGIRAALDLALGGRHWLGRVLAGHDAIDGCLALSHEIRTTASNLERAPNPRSKCCCLVGRRLLGMDECLGCDLLLVAQVDVKAIMLAAFELIGALEVGYPGKQAMLLGKLVIHCL